MDKVLLVRLVCADPFQSDSQALVIKMFFSSWFRQGHTFASVCPALRHMGESISLSTSQLFQLRIIFMPTLHILQ